VCRPLKRPQTAQNCGSCKFDASVKNFTENEKSLQRPLYGRQTAYKLQKIVGMNADISENIKDRELRLEI